MRIADKKIAVFIAAGFEDPELVKPVEALKDAGAEVTLIGLTGGRAPSQKAGGRFSNKPVIIDGNLITSRMPRDIPAFIEAVFDALDATEEESRRKIA
ncbi:MAG: DJ-1/PfpI family protein [Thermoleophilia bacterium]